MTDEAETQLTKGYNHKAVKALDEVLGKLRGMDVGSALFRATLLLKLCRARRLGLGLGLGLGCQP